MEQGQIRSFASTDDVSKAVDNKDIKQVKTFSIAKVTDLKGRRFDYNTEGVSVILSTDTTDQLATLWDRRQLLEFAKEILRLYEPTAEEQILDALKQVVAVLQQIENRLQPPTPTEPSPKEN